MSTHEGRTLKTARAVLQVLRMLEQAPAGLTAAEVAVRLGRSTSTASNLLNTLLAEGYAERDERTACYRASGQRTSLAGPARGGATRPRVAASGTRAQTATAPTPAPLGATRPAVGVAAPQPAAAVPASSAPPVALPEDALAELYGRTGERVYFASTEPDRIVVQATRGRQGLPSVPGLRPTIRGEAHALAVGKAVLAHLGADAVDAYAERYGLRAFTGCTITDPAVLDRALADVRARGIAVDREEYAEGFTCLAAPLLDATGQPVAALALSLPARRYDERAADLVAELAGIAAAALDHAEAPEDPAGAVLARPAPPGATRPPASPTPARSAPLTPAAGTAPLSPRALVCASPPTTETKELP